MVLALPRPWRHPKTGIYWYRRRVPKELRLLVGRCEVRRTLRTKEPALARSRFLLTALEIEERWTTLRAASGAGHNSCCGDRCVDQPGAHGARPLFIEARPVRVAEIDAAGSPGRVPGDPVPWRPVFAAYANEARLAPATVKRWTGIFKALEEALGTDDLRRVRKEDLISWKTSLLADGRAPRTVRDAYIAAVRTVSNWAVANGRLGISPAMGIKVVVQEKHMMLARGLTDSEAARILGAALGPHSARMSVEHAAARRWIPWLCAYGGARVNEMTQLRGCDIRLEDGMWVLRITPEAGTVKNGRWRDVPIHPHLIEQGFDRFVRDRGPGPLFYDPARGRDGSAANPIYKKVGERLAAWVRALGVDQKEVNPNHGWRHRFKTVGRRVGIEHGILDAIQGHAPRTEGEKYGSFPVEVMFDAICRMPRYELSGSSAVSSNTTGPPSAGTSR